VVRKRVDRPLSYSPARWDDDRIRLLEKVFDEIKCLEKNDLIVVEGKNDIQSLRLIGVNCKIITQKELSGLTKVVLNKQTKGSHFILLPDFDQEGQENIRRWRKLLERTGLVNDTLWKRLRTLTKGDIMDIQSLSVLARRFRMVKEEIWLDPDEPVS